MRCFVARRRRAGRLVALALLLGESVGCQDSTLHQDVVATPEQGPPGDRATWEAGALVDRGGLTEAGALVDRGGPREVGALVDRGGSREAGPLQDSSSQPSCAKGICPAFPGAQGSGAVSVGGRGDGSVTPAVCVVTSLADSGAGSLRSCVQASGPRFVVFRVAGTIWLQSTLEIANPYVTIAGQTAPGGGIQLAGPAIGAYGYALRVSTHDVVVRYLRVRLGYNAARAPGANKGGQCIFMGGASKVFNVMLDHLSIAWGTDENVTAWLSSGGQLQRFTLSWSINAEAFNGPTVTHSCGYITGSDSGDAVMKYVTDLDFHHNLNMTLSHRVPLFKHRSSRWVNNIDYNYAIGREGSRWGFAVQTVGGITFDAIGNRFKYGPTALLGGGNPHEFQVSADYNGSNVQGTPSIHLLGNLGPHQSSPTGDQWAMTAEVTGESGSENASPIRSAWRRSAPMATTDYPIVPDSAASLESILPPTVGASRRLDENGAWVPNRDAMDARLIGDLQNGTACGGKAPCPPTRESDVGGFPAIQSGTPYTDSDLDGMPDAWEIAHGLDPKKAADAVQKSGDGYLWIEKYLAGM